MDEILDPLKKFCQKKIEPYMEGDDENARFRPEIIAGLGELGFGGVATLEQWGGAGLDYLTYCKILEVISYTSIPYAVTHSVSGMVQNIIEMYGSDQQKATYLPKLASGKSIGAFALSEASSGSDAASLKTSAKKVDGGFELNGTKLWITSGGVADTYIVMARTGQDGPQGISAFIVEKDTPGFSFGKAEKKMGWKTSPTRELVFEKCFIPDSQLLQELGIGFNVAKSALDRGRITIASIAVGGAQRAFDEAVKYSKIRKQFDQAIFEFQGIQFMLADMLTDIECSRLLVQKAVQEFDAGTPNTLLASMAKMKATDSAMRVTTDAVQILGGVGYTTEYPVERFMRDAKVLQIVEGTNQVQRVVMARKISELYN